MKYYGIYLAYAPSLDLRHEGLGRYLAAFVKGASLREDVRFVLVCPSWSRQGIAELFASEGIPEEKLEIVSPAKKPLVLRVYEAYLERKKRNNKSRLVQWMNTKIAKFKTALSNHVEHRLVATQSVLDVLWLLVEGLAALAVIAIISPVIIAILFGFGLVKAPKIARRVLRRVFRRFGVVSSRVGVAVEEPKDDAFVLRLYKRMESIESEKMLKLINAQKKVKAWYSPTAFWPEFNKISAPRLMCVPDVVLSDFPVEFSALGGDRYMQTFESVRRAIQTGQNFITYSEAIKWETLVDQYSVKPSDVTVIHHAPNMLHKWVTTRGFADLVETSKNYCWVLLSSAMRKSSNRHYASGFKNSSFKFMFYASQFRPNKNLLMLLKAYEYLLRNRFLSHKLILTGDSSKFPVVKKFIAEHGLQNDVLCLHGLSIQELAACYKLADLAVNPSLSEGGCPFTFTEALSVDTPVVMARIPVTEEILNQPEIQDTTFFDPYDWEDMARRIEWALLHREELLVQQKAIYERLIQRTWTDVVNEHITVLDAISAEAGNPSEVHS
ncbi:glycosyltransferase [Pseudomonas vancouverensis]|nr:glycosyltransferase [Pseudomonas vancouverensis]SDU92299.1 hypothetical protein SAMN05216558_0733 [Pseudomonas vancouverensis]